MKKILTILLVLVLTVGAVFAADNQSQVVVTAQVVAGEGTGTGGGIGGTGYGYFITFDKTTEFNDAIKITGTQPNELDVAKPGEYGFSLWYYGKEAVGTSHTVKISADTDWVKDGLAGAALANQKTALTVENATVTPSTTSSVENTATGTNLGTTFGKDSSVAVKSDAPIKVGTYGLSWEGNADLEVGEYKATVTFTVASV